MQQLRIIDKSNENNEQNQVEIKLIVNEKTFSNIVDYFPSPIDETFQQELNWYFNDFLIQPFGKNRKIAQRTVSNIEKFGKLMGKRLFKEDDSQNSIRSKIDEIGLKNIIVSIESDQPEFFEEPWEILIFQENQCLATSCAGFIRTKPNGLNLETKQKLDREGPLRVLMVISRPQLEFSSHPLYQTKA